MAGAPAASGRRLHAGACMQEPFSRADVIHVRQSSRPLWQVDVDALRLEYLFAGVLC